MARVIETKFGGDQKKGYTKAWSERIVNCEQQDCLPQTLDGEEVKYMKEERKDLSANTAQQGIYEVVWPRDKRVLKIMSLSERLDTLAGKTVGELWDYAFRGDEVFSIIERELAERYPGITFVSYDRFGCTHGKDEAKVIADLPSNLKKYNCDAVISGVGC